MPYGKSWKSVILRFTRCVGASEIWDGAATLAFYFMLSIFPAMIALIALLPFLPIPNLNTQLMDLLQQSMPGEAHELFTGAITQITSEKQGGLVSLGFLFALWSASTGIHAVMRELNRIEGVREERSCTRQRLIATALTLGTGLLVILAFATILVGNLVIEWGLGTFGIAHPNVALIVLSIVRWTIVVTAMLFALGMVYRFGPTPRSARHRFNILGAGNIAGVVLFVASSVGFKLYVTNFTNYNATYGSIGAVIILMLWLYVTGLVILLGGLVDNFQRGLMREYEERAQAQAQARERERARLPAA
jgi:membrane protein